MNRITEITKRDVLDLFQNGLEIDEFFQTRTVTYIIITIFAVKT